VTTFNSIGIFIGIQIHNQYMPKIVKQKSMKEIESHRFTKGSLCDGNGLYFKFDGQGNIQCIYRYTFGGLRRNIGLGSYSKHAISDVRNLANTYATDIKNNIDPLDKKRAIKESLKVIKRDSFGVVAEEWYQSKLNVWHSKTAKRARQLLDRYLLPPLSNKKISTLSTPEVKPVLEYVDRKTKSLGPRAKQFINSIITYAIQEGLRQDGKFLSLQGIAVKRQGGHYPAVTSVSDLNLLVTKIHNLKSDFLKTAVLLTLYTGSRPGMIVSLAWSEVNFKYKEIHIPAIKMKMKHDHIIPLSSQCIQLLKAQKLKAGKSSYVFPGKWDLEKHIHRDSLSQALRNSGLRDISVTHGFRATFRTLARERLGIDVDKLEAQLAHAKANEIEAAYDRTGFVLERHQIMQKWADYLDSFMNPVKILIDQARA
jgi:integrase